MEKRGAAARGERGDGSAANAGDAELTGVTRSVAMVHRFPICLNQEKEESKASLIPSLAWPGVSPRWVRQGRGPWSSPDIMVKALEGFKSHKN
jgi:hypothetical protein